VISYRTYKSPPLAIAADDPTVLYIRWYRYYIAGIAPPPLYVCRRRSTQLLLCHRHTNGISFFLSLWWFV
jgi:hypothetical protein